MTKITLAAMLILTFISVSRAQDPGWPRQKSSPAGRLVYYQPQVDEWKENKELDFRMAFSLTPRGGKETVGVVSLHAFTDVNIDARTVMLSGPSVTGTHFPSLDADAAAKMDQLVRTFLPPSSAVVISLDRLVASVNKSQPVTTVEVRNDPPDIFVSERPAILVHVDGEPVRGRIPKTELEFVVNSNWPLFFDKSKSGYYLYTDKQWLTAVAPQGPWVVATTLPRDMSKLKSDPQWSGLAKAIPPPAGAAAVPTVFYSTRPAEVILFQGQPLYSKIPGTQLVYAANTESDLLVHTPTKQFYYLAAGRWFRADSLQGPWTYASADLPADFANIPVSSPASRVLVSVPGTEQAKDAVLLAQIPTTVTVDPKAAAAKVNVSYNGEPEFKPIEGTSLSYATNTADKVLKVGDVYLLCLQGVWFTSPNAKGPWTTAESVPDPVYTIPPSSPVYNVTYVKQTVTPNGYVQSTYTAGYFGSYAVGCSVGYVVTSGTGYYYPPYFYYPYYGYPIYRPYVATYGVGSFYNPYTGAYGVARGVYGPYGGATGWAAYNPYTGTYARGVHAYGPYGSASAGRAYNPYTGVGVATRQASTPYAHWGSSVVTRGNQAVQTGHVSNSQGTLVGARSTSGAKAIAGSGAYGSGGVVKTAGGDMYAAKDGNIYRNTGDGWQHHDNGNWSHVTGNSSGRPLQSEQYQAMNREFENRQRGAYQSQQFQNFQRSGGRAGSYGGGGRYGGSAGRYGGGGGRRGGGRRR